MGTLMTHRQHRASTDPLIDIGLQDITAHVNFSAIAEAAASAGALPIGYVSQSAFLIDCGIAELLGEAAMDTRAWAAQSAAVNMLMSEAEMGELFKVIALARKPRELLGFRRRDRTHTL
jgi:SAM-dependent MidA family methyltransferase